MWIDSSPLQAAVMGTGQGGPYQLNNYDVDLAEGGYTPKGYALLNYALIKPGWGSRSRKLPRSSRSRRRCRSIARTSPPCWRRSSTSTTCSLHELESAGFTPVPAFDRCLANLRGVDDAPIDVLLSYAYNQGFYGGLLTQATALCATDLPAFVASANDWANAQGGGFDAYPYQVRFYLDELYNRSTLRPQTANHLFFSMASARSGLRGRLRRPRVRRPGGALRPDPSRGAARAFASALQRLRVASRQSLDVSDATQRATIFAVLEDAVARTEAATGHPLSATTAVQL